MSHAMISRLFRKLTRDILNIEIILCRSLCRSEEKEEIFHILRNKMEKLAMYPKLNFKLFILSHDER